MRALVVGSMLFAAIGPIACSSSVRESVDGVTEAIVDGGVDMKHDAVVYIHSVTSTTPFREEQCSGTLVAVRGYYGYVLTAAHCVRCAAPATIGALTTGVEDLDLIDVIEGFDDSSSSTMRYTVTAGICDARATSDVPSSHDDIAVLRVFSAKPFPAPIGMRSDDVLKIGTPVQLAGYGSVSAPNIQPQRHIARNVLTYRDAADAVGYVESNGGGACYGDSGGPMLVTIEGTDYVAAVTTNTYGGNNCTGSAYADRIWPTLATIIQPFIDAPIDTNACTLPKPKTLCKLNGGWRCCGTADGWVCGVCS